MTYERIRFLYVSERRKNTAHTRNGRRKKLKIYLLRTADVTIFHVGSMPAAGICKRRPQKWLQFISIRLIFEKEIAHYRFEVIQLEIWMDKRDLG